MNPLSNALFEPLFARREPFLHLSSGRSISHAEFFALARGMAADLARDLAPGAILAAQVTKSPEALALYVACVMAGIVFLPLNPAYTKAEVDYFLTDSGAARLIDDAALAALGQTNADFVPVARKPDDLAALLYTSGTTGRAKGAMLTHDNLLSNALTLKDLWGFSAQDVLLHALPIFHTHGLFVATNTVLAAGASMIFLPKFDAAEACAHIPKASVMMGVPTFYTRLLDHPGLDQTTCARMRLFISGSAPLLAETHRQFQARTGHVILERYGMTETNMNTSNPLNGRRKAGTVGLPLPGVSLRVRGAPGVVEVKGPNVFAGYWNMPEKTAAEFTEDGYFITGDLGRLDDDGYLEIIGRAKDLIISGGLNVYPKEVELLLDAQPGVVESAVIGVPHADLGEAVVAILTGTPDIAALRAVLKSALANFKQPKEFVVVTDLPRNAMGKVQKAELRKTYATLFISA